MSRKWSANTAFVDCHAMSHQVRAVEFFRGNAPGGETGPCCPLCGGEIQRESRIEASVEIRNSRSILTRLCCRDPRQESVSLSYLCPGPRLTWSDAERCQPIPTKNANSATLMQEVPGSVRSPTQFLTHGMKSPVAFSSRARNC